MIQARVYERTAFRQSDATPGKPDKEEQRHLTTSMDLQNYGTFDSDRDVRRDPILRACSWLGRPSPGQKIINDQKHRCSSARPQHERTAMARRIAQDRTSQGNFEQAFSSPLKMSLGRLPNRTSGWCMDRLGSMAVFVKVVEGSSFAAAARHFRMSPAMVSKHVKALEERIGVRLLNRTTRRVNPTEVGQSYYGRCLHILADFEEAEREAGDANVRPRGLLKISAPFTFGIAHVGPALADYLATYPDVSAELVLNDRSMDLLENGFDVAIRVGHLPDSSLIGRRLITAQTVLCASPHYLDRFGVPRTLQD